MTNADYVSISNLFQFVGSVEHVGDVLGGFGLRLGLEGGDLHGWETFSTTVAISGYESNKEEQEKIHIFS